MIARLVQALEVSFADFDHRIENLYRKLFRGRLPLVVFPEMLFRPRQRAIGDVVFVPAPAGSGHLSGA